MPTLSRNDVTLFSRLLAGVLSALVILSAIFHFGEEEIKSAFGLEGTVSAFIWLRNFLDLGWAISVFFAAYWCCVVEDGLAAARRYALIAIVLSYSLGLLVSHLDFATGLVMHFTDAAGPRLPLGISSGVVLLVATIFLATRAALWRFARHQPFWLLIVAGTILISAILLLLQFCVAIPRAWWLWVAADGSVRVAKAPWSAILPCVAISAAYLTCTKRAFSARESEGGWIILGILLLVEAVCGFARWGG